VGKSTLGAQMRMAVLVLGIFHFLNLQVQTFVFNYSMVTILLKNADGTLLPLSFFFFFFPPISSMDVFHLPERVEGPFLKSPVSKVCCTLFS